MQRSRGAEVFRGGKAKQILRCKGAEVQRCRGAGADMEVLRGAEVVV